MKNKVFLVMVSAFAILLFLGVPSYATNKAEEEVALVKIDGQTITQDDLNTFFNTFYYREEVKAKLDKLPEFRRNNIIARQKGNALKKLIQRNLLLAAAENRFLKKERMAKIIDEMTDNRMEHIKNSADSWVEFVQRLHDRDVSLQEWKRLLRESILIQNYIREETRNDIRIRPVEVKRYYNEHRENYTRPRTIVYRLIIVDPELCHDSQTPQELASAIHQKLSEGASFEKMVEKYSLNRDQAEGGLKRTEVPEDKSDWMPPVVRGLEPGEMSEVQKRDYGYTIARLERIIPAGTEPYEKVQEEIQKRLRENRRREVQKKLIKRLRNEANVDVLPAGRRIMGN